MPLAYLTLSLLLVAGFGLSAWLEPWFQNWAGSRTHSPNLLAVALGDSRKLFARHFYVKADVYLHGGMAPTIFDTQPPGGELALSAASKAGEPHQCVSFLGEPKDWIDRFSRHFYPVVHKHLGEHGHQHEEHAAQGEGPDHHECEHHGEEPPGLERELLPWLKASALLDPERPETYVVAAYWLRTLEKVDEAEQFLREGLRANPNNCEILLELGRVYFENRKNANRARTLWELALANWRLRANAQQNSFTGIQVLSSLAKLEMHQENNARAIEHFEALLQLSPSKIQIQAWIDYLRAQQSQ